LFENIHLLPADTVEYPPLLKFDAKQHGQIHQLKQPRPAES
jgi:hypothetical protein